MSLPPCCSGVFTALQRSTLGISNVCIRTQSITWLTAGSRDIWVQFDTNSKCCATLKCVSPPPPFFFFWKRSRWLCNLHSAVRDRVWIFWAALPRARQSKPNHGIGGKMQGGRQLSPSSRDAGLLCAPYLWWKKVPAVPSPPPTPYSSSFLFQPNLLLWVSARGILSPSVSTAAEDSEV